MLRPLKEVVGISILRSGGPFSHGLRRVLRDVPIGAMLIQSDPKTGEPLLLSSDLPQSVKSGQSCENVRVLLLDSQVSGPYITQRPYSRVIIRWGPVPLPVRV